MNPLMFVNFERLNEIFVGLMWIIAISLACAVIAHSASASSPHHQTHQTMIGLPR